MKKFLATLFAHCDINEESLVEVRLLPEGSQRFFSSLEQIPDYVKDKKTNVFFGCGLRGRARGRAQDVCALPFLWVDVDIKNFGGDRTAAAHALWDNAPGGRGQWTAIVESGGGFHGYRRLDRPVTSEDEMRLLVAANREIARRAGGDLNATDVARILRLPETRNYKYSPPRPVTVKFFDTPDLPLSWLDQFKQDEREVIRIMGERPEGIVSLEERCDFIAHCRDDASHLPEPEWYAWISNLCGIHGSPSYIHRVSAQYGGYSPQETDKKILQALDNSAPITCERIKRMWDCGKSCGVRAPVGLLWRPAPIIISNENPFTKKDERRKALTLAAIPERGFLKEYVDFASSLTDAPTIFHLFSGLVLLASAVGRKAWVPGFGGRPLYPNLWAILLAPSSTYRKSTAVAIARDLMDDCGVRIYPDDFSKEELIAILAANPQGVFVWGEFGNVLTQLDRDYMSGTKDMMADLYDCIDSYKRQIRSGEYVIERPCLSILGATNIDWMLDKRNVRADLRGGFLARCLFVPFTSKDFEMDSPGEVDEAKRMRLVGFLRDMRDRAPVEFSTQGLDEMQRVFREELDEVARQSEYMIELSAAFTRYQAVLLKVALLHAISDGGWGETISRSCFERAVATIRLLKESIMEILQQTPMHRDDKILTEVQAKMLQLHASGRVWIERRDILRYTHRRAREINPVLDTLVEMGRVIQDGNKYQLVSE